MAAALKFATTFLVNLYAPVIVVLKQTKVMKKLAWVSTKKIMSKSISKTINIYKFTYHLLDIDECADPELSWDCTAGCKNLNGTYKCLPSLVGRVEPTDGDGFSPGEIVCKSGFKQSDDGSECQDINECDLADIDSDSGRMTYRYCEHKCENTVGSYICHCPQGYHLLEDQNSCILDGSKLPPSKDAPVSQEAPRKDICPLFKGPANGKASCDKYLQNGFNYTRCNITCNAGYIMQGSQFAVCGHTGLWSSPEAKCVGKYTSMYNVQTI